MFLKTTKTLIVTQRFKNKLKYIRTHNYVYTLIQVNLCYFKDSKQDVSQLQLRQIKQ